MSALAGWRLKLPHALHRSGNRTVLETIIFDHCIGGKRCMVMLKSI